MGLVRAASVSAATILPATFTVDTLPTPTDALVGTYARVSDLFGEKTDLVLCAKSGAALYWQPVRPVYAKTMSADQSQSLHALKSPSVLFLTGNVSANRTITLPAVGAWPGAEFEIAMEGTFAALTTLNLMGTGLGSGLAVLAGARRRVFFDGGSWRQFT